MLGALTGVIMEIFLCETFLWPIMYKPKMGTVKARKLGVRSKIFLFSKMVHDNGNRSADICLVMQAVRRAGHQDDYANRHSRNRKFALSIPYQFKPLNNANRKTINLFDFQILISSQGGRVV